MVSQSFNGVKMVKIGRVLHLFLTVITPKELYKSSHPNAV